MNEFTKEEIEILLNGLLWRDATILLIDRPEKLKSKIQSMIENYCEHEEEYEDFNYHPMRCKKCLEITG